jgi:hypothetical protein
VTKRPTARRALRTAAAAVAIATALTPPAASAAACCISATSFGVGRLLMWEEAAFGVSVGHARLLGEFETSTAFRPYGAAYTEGLTSVQPWAIVRVHPRIQLQAFVPVLVNDREGGGQRQVSGTVGDIGAAARFEFTAIGEYLHVPALALTVGVVAPTGRRVEATSPPLFAGATGLGAWQGALGLEGEYAFLPYFVRLNVGGSGFAPFTRADTGQRQVLGPLVQVAAATGREVVPDKVVVAASLQFDWQADAWLDSVRAPSSQASQFTVSLSVAWRVRPHWTLTCSAYDTAWPDGLGRNRDGRVGLSIGARYGLF